MSLMIELPPEMERRLQDEAARKGMDTAEFAQAVLEERVAAERRERAQRLVALLDQWMAEPPDLEEAEGYPLEITPLSLREISVE